LTLVEVLVSPARLRQIQSVLAHVGVEGMTTSEVRGFGRGAFARSRETSTATPFIPHLKIEIVLETGRVPLLVDEIRRSSRTPIGDGLIFILPVEEAIRIRTRERGGDAV
jgi:nitrogen regulatory protein PII